MKSPEHKFAKSIFVSDGGVTMPRHVKLMADRNQKRVITCMKLGHFITKEDLAVRKYNKLCDLAYALEVESMHVKDDYSSYTNVIAGKELVFCISQYPQEVQLKKLNQSPFYGLMVDETTDRALEKHLIVYVSYLSSNGLSLCKIEFIRLILVADGSAQTKYDALMKMLSEIGLDVMRMVGIATDGDSSMLGCYDG